MAASNRDTIYQYQDGKFSSHIDVAFTSSLICSGIVLQLNGSDAPLAKAASHFLRCGKLPPVTESLLRQHDLNFFKIFLRGTRAEFESEETFEVVSVCSGSGK